MASRQAQLRPCRSVRPELVGDERLGREAQLPEQFAHQLRGRPCVAPPWHKEIENLALVVDRRPEPKLSAADPDSHLVEVPLGGWSMTSAAKFLGEQRPKLEHPSSGRFIGDVQPALGQQIFDIAEAQGKAKIQPPGARDDVRRELVASERDLPWAILPTKETSVTVGMTKPYQAHF